MIAQVGGGDRQRKRAKRKDPLVLQDTSGGTPWLAVADMGQTGVSRWNCGRIPPFVLAATLQNSRGARSVDGLDRHMPSSYHLLEDGRKMIRVPTQSRYALRAMVDIGRHQHLGPVLRQDIARRQDISANYVAQIFRKLASAELVVGIKGPGGGYQLAKPSEQIRAGDILRAIEGPFALVHCVLDDDEAPCTRADRCVAHRLWTRLSQTLEECLDSITLQDLMDESAELDAK